MSFIDRINEELQSAMRTRDALRLNTLRMVKAALKNQEIENRGPLDDAASLAVLQRLCKQRKDSIEQFEKGNRQDLADKERAELGIIEGYLPAQVDEATLRTAVEEAVQATGATSPKQMGAVMGKVMARFKGQAVDGKRVQQLVQELLRQA